MALSVSPEHMPGQERSYLAATASQAQHCLVSTPLKLNTFCALHSTLLTSNNHVFHNNEFNTTSIQHYFNSTALNFNKLSSTPLTFNNLNFNNLTLNNLILNTPYIQQPYFQQFPFQQSHFQQSHVHHVFLFCRTTRSCIIKA